MKRGGELPPTDVQRRDFVEELTGIRLPPSTPGVIAPNTREWPGPAEACGLLHPAHPLSERMRPWWHPSRLTW
jgi:hypothetical protein